MFLNVFLDKILLPTNINSFVSSFQYLYLFFVLFLNLPGYNIYCKVELNGDKCVLVFSWSQWKAFTIAPLSI